MSEIRRYGRSVRDPIIGSRYAYLVRSLEIVENEDERPYSTGIIPILPDMSVSERRSAERWNPFISEYRDAVREEVVSRLRTARVPAELLEDPVCPEMHSFVEEQIDRECERWDHAIVWRRETHAPNETPAPSDQAMFMATILQGSCARAAEWLMSGAPRSQKSGRLTRDHIYRANKRFEKILAQMPARVVREAALFVTINRVRALVHVQHEARRRALPFGCAGGAEFADQLHARYDLRNVVGKAYCRIGLTEFPSLARKVAA